MASLSVYGGGGGSGGGTLDAELAALAALASGANQLPYFTGSGTAALTPLSPFARTLIDDADAATARGTLGLGSAATQASSTFDAAGAAAAAQAASQPLDPELTALGGLVSAADKLPYFTGSGTAAVTALSSFARSLIDDVDAATARATLGTDASGASRPPSGAAGGDLTGTYPAPTLGANVVTQAKASIGTGSTQLAGGNDTRFPTVGEKNALAGSDGAPGTGNEFLTKNAIGVRVDAFGAAAAAQAASQPVDAELTAIAGLVSAADRAPYFTGLGTAALAVQTAFARTLIDDPDATTARTTLGLGTAATKDAGVASGVATLDSGGLLPASQLPSSAQEFKGAWNASTNTPTLADGTGNTGDTYRVTAASARNLGSGAIDFQVGDAVMYDGATWFKLDNTDSVTSVAGRTGVVTLAVGDVSGAEATANKGVASGYASLDGSTKVPGAQIPTITQSLASIGTGSTQLAGGNDARFPTTGEKNALAGSDGVPGTGNEYLTKSGIGTRVQAWDADLDAVAALATAAYGRSLLTQANASAARTTLGLVLGTDVQAHDVELDALAGLVSAADKAPYFTGSGTAALATQTAFARTLIDDVDATAARATLGLVIGTDVQGIDAELTALAGLASAADKVPYFTGSGTAALATQTAFARTLIDDVDAAAARTTLGLVIGTDVQAVDPELTALAGLVSAADKAPYFTGSGTAALATQTAFARTLLDDVDAAAARATLLLGTAATKDSGVANGVATLDSGGLLPASQLPSSAQEFKGAWNASTNTPTLADGAGNAGDTYRVTAAASRNLGSGAIDFQVGDAVMYDGATWFKLDNTDAVSSVAGKTGVVSLVEGDITNLTSDLALKAPLASPAFTGVPTVPTAAVDTSTTQAASTAYVVGQNYGKRTELAGGMTISQIDFFGHSITAFASSYIAGTASRLGQLMGAEIRDYTINGANMVNHDKGAAFLNTWNGDGGWAHTYLFASPGAHGAPYLAQRDCVVFYSGVNDLVNLGTANLPTPFKNSLRASISRLRASAVFEDSDASVTYPNGTWATVTPAFPVVQQSGTTYKKITVAPGGTNVQIAVPADFPGGTAVVAFLAGPDGKGALWSVVVDGGAPTAVETRNVQPKDASNVDRNMWTPVVLRLTGLAAGAHTITATVTTLNTEAYFDCWWIEAPVPPLIDVVRQSYTDQNAGLFHPTDADVDTLNSNISTVVAEFDASVISTDMRTAISVSTDLLDGLHYNDQGHAKAAAQYVTDFLANIRSIDSNARGAGKGSFLSREPASLWDSANAANLRNNVIQATRPDVIPLTFRNPAFGTSASPFLRFEDRDASLLSFIDRDGSYNIATPGTSAAVKLYSVFGFPILGLGLAALTGGADVLSLSGGSASVDSVQIGSQSGLTAKIVRFRAGATDWAYINNKGSFRSAANAGLDYSFQSLSAYSDANPLFGVIGASLVWGPGGASVVDVNMTRVAADRLEMASGDTIGWATGAMGTVWSTAMDTSNAPTSTAVTQNQGYLVRKLIPNRTTITGIRVLNGATVAGNLKVALFDNAATLNRLAISNATAQAGINTGQDIPFTATYDAHPGLYHFWLASDSTTATLQMAKNFQPGSTTATEYVTPPTTKTKPTAPAAAALPMMSTY